VKDALLVRRLEGTHNLQRQGQRLFDGHRPVQLLALDIFEHKIARADVVKLTDVGVIQRGDRPRFVLESTATIGVGGEWLRKDFDRDITLEAGIARAINITHAAAAER
jgi:hypothetical protein